MTRRYKNANNGMYGDSMLQDALRLVKGGMPLVRVGKELGVPARTVRRQRDDPVTWEDTVGLSVDVAD